MEKIEEIVNEVIIDYARKEALDILELAPEKDKLEFIKYYNDKNFNCCCLHLDFIKHNLVKDGKMKLKEGDNFGDIDWMDENF